MLALFGQPIRTLLPVSFLDRPALYMAGTSPFGTLIHFRTRVYPFSARSAQMQNQSAKASFERIIALPHPPLIQSSRPFPSNHPPPAPSFSRRLWFIFRIRLIPVNAISRIDSAKTTSIPQAFVLKPEKMDQKS
jgi:hypothetical protein